VASLADAYHGEAMTSRAVEGHATFHRNGETMRTSLLVFTALSLSSCGEPKYDYAGYRTYEHFPLDGERYWSYQSSSQEHMLDVSIESTEFKGDTAVKTLRYVNASLDSLMYSIKWSSDSRNGVQIHGYMLEEGVDTSGGDDTGVGSDAIVGVWVDFSPALHITEHQMAPGGIVKSEGNGVKYTSTFAAVEKCENNWADTPWDCIRVVIESDEAEPAPFVGTWHWATEFGTSLFQPLGAETPWMLTDFDWDHEG
jgi:hypothetical protein